MDSAFQNPKAKYARNTFRLARLALKYRVLAPFKRAKRAASSMQALPLSLVLSWYEQKAVCILLTLLHLGIKNIRLGPSLPAFVTPAVLKVLVDNFAIKPITTVEADLKACLVGA